MGCVAQTCLRPACLPYSTDKDNQTTDESSAEVEMDKVDQILCLRLTAAAKRQHPWSTQISVPQNSTYTSVVLYHNHTYTYKCTGVLYMLLLTTLL